MNEQLTQLLTQLAQKLGTTIDYLWGVEVHQAYIDAYSDVVWALMWLAACIVLPFVIRWGVKTTLSDEWDTIGLFTAIFGAISLIGAVIGFGICVTDAIGHFANPAHYALEYILGAVKGN